MMRRRPVVSLLAAGLLVACSSGERRPPAWGEPRLAEGDACPTLIGRYLADGGPVAFQLTRRAPRGPASSAAAESFAIEEQTDSTLHVSVRYAEGEDSRVVLHRGNAWAGEFHCDDGWLQVRLDGGRSRWDTLARPGGHVAKRRTVRIAPARDGALIARLDAVWFEGIQPYAPGSGDGIPLPWTWTRAHAWLRVEPFSEAALAQRQTKRAGTPTGAPALETDAATLDAVRSDPVWQANEALEQGTPLPPRGASRARR